MTTIDLKHLTVGELVNRFVTLGIEQDQAELLGDSRKFKPLFHMMKAVEDELRSREGDQRIALVALHGHPNMQVRWKAAEATLVVAPEAAREALTAIWESKWYPQAADAGMTLRALARGTYKPT